MYQNTKKINDQFKVVLSILFINLIFIFSTPQTLYAASLGDIVTSVAEENLTDIYYQFEPEDRTGKNINMHLAVGDYEQGAKKSAITLLGPTNTEGMQAILGYMDSVSTHIGLETKRMDNYVVRKYTFATGVAIGVLVDDYFIEVEIHDMSGAGSANDYDKAIRMAQSTLDRMQASGLIAQGKLDIEDAIDEGVTIDEDAIFEDPAMDGDGIEDIEDIGDIDGILPLDPVDKNKDKDKYPEDHEHSPGGVGSVGSIPGPTNTTEAVVGVVVPGLIATGLGALPGIGGGGGSDPTDNIITFGSRRRKDDPNDYDPDDYDDYEEREREEREREEREQAERAEAEKAATEKERQTDGFDQDGYDAQGYDAQGYDRNGKHWNSSSDLSEDNPFNIEDTIFEVVDGKFVKKGKAAPVKPPLGQPYPETSKRYPGGEEDLIPTIEEPESMVVQVTPQGAEILIIKDPETGAWINSETGNEFNIEQHQANFPQQVKDYQDFIERNEELERTGQTAMQQALNQIDQEAREREEMQDWLVRIRQAAMRHDLDQEGQIDNMVARVERELDNLNAGGKIDVDRYNRMAEYIGNRVAGNYLGPDYVVKTEKYGGILDADIWKEALGETGRTVSKVSNSDGSFSWKGLAARILIGIATQGRSEAIFIGMSGTYTLKDEIDKGSSDLGSMYEASKQMAGEYLLGRFIGAGLKTGAAGVKGGVKGAVTAGKESFKTGVKEVTDLFSKEAWKSTVKGHIETVKNGAKGIKDLLKGKAPVTGPSAKDLTNLSAAERSALEKFDKAMKGYDPSKVTDLYKNQGMNKLSQLQQKGYISAREAKRLNEILKSQVEASIEKGSKTAIEDMKRLTGVRIDELVIGDSGSSARGGLSRVATDFDRTVIAKFNAKDLARYAKTKGISQKEAYEELSKSFTRLHEGNVGKALNNVGLTSNDVGYNSYDRIGSASGHSDSYTSGFTNSRQAVSGTGKVYRMNPDGTIKDPYKISGQTVTDRNLLNNQQYNAGKIPSDATKIQTSEAKSIIRQQVSSVDKAPNNPVNIAKAVGRAEKTANLTRNSLGDKNLSRAAKEIYDNPGQIDSVLKKYGYVDQNNNPDIRLFCRKGREAVKGIDQMINSAK